jgi:ABC-type multidrug transport system fused ATPase/permease subunit
MKVKNNSVKVIPTFSALNNKGLITLAIVIVIILLYIILTELKKIIRQWTDYQTYLEQVKAVELQNTKDFEIYKQKVKEHEEQLKKQSYLNSILAFFSSGCPDGFRWDDQHNGCILNEKNPYYENPLPDAVYPPTYVQMIGLVIQIIILFIVLVFIMNPQKGKNILLKLAQQTSIIKQVGRLLINNIDLFIYTYNMYLIYSLYNAYQTTTLFSFPSFIKEHTSSILFIFISPTLIRFIDLMKV